MHSRICELSTFGLSPNRILKLHPELNLSTIKSTIRREASRINNASKSRSGRPRALTEEQRDHVYDIVNHTNPHIKMRDLLCEVDDVIKKRSLQGLLREMGKRKWIQKKRPIITIAHAQARLNWAIRHQAYTLYDWMKVSWSDECTVERGVGVKPTWTFTRPGDQILARDVQPVRCTGKGVKKMLWAAFGHNRRTGLVPLDGDPEAARGGVTSWVIRALYEAFLPEIMVDGGEFMYDGAGPHRGLIIRDILREMGIRVMEWPPYSPNLNPIENLWALMKAELYRLHPELEHAPDTVETLDALIRGAQEAWHNIDNGILYRLATTMDHRIQAVINAEGWYTKY
jgi:transposase